jgi:hypothetical protein
MSFRLGATRDATAFVTFAAWPLPDRLPASLPLEPRGDIASGLRYAFAVRKPCASHIRSPALIDCLPRSL